MKPTDGRYQTEIRFRVKVSSLENFNIEGVDSVHSLEGREKGRLAPAMKIRFLATDEHGQTRMIFS